MQPRSLVRALAATALVGTFPVVLAAAGPPAAPEDLTWGECPVVRPDAAVRCGVLRVPENWRTGRGRRIGISFAVLAARSPTERRPDAVLFLSGGPGVSAFEPLERFARSPLRARRDIVIIELRGYGYSDPALTCDGVAQLPDCYRAAKVAGIDPDQYGTESALHDAEALRRALKFVPWNVYGVSYGSFALLHYARLYPEGVRTMLLDSTYPANAGYQWSLQSGVNAIQKVLDDCGADPRCNGAFPNLEQRFFALLRRLDGAPDRFAE